jgi:hypothetical protein
MAELDNIVQITISRETTAVDTASFNIPLILSDITNFSERTRTYTDIDALGEDFVSTSNVYKMAEKEFSQSYGKVPSLVVGRRQIDGVDGSVPVATVGQVYTITVNGTNYSYTAASGNTAIVIVAGIKTAWDSAPKAGITFTNNLDGTFELDVNVAGTAWSITSSSNVTLVNKTPTETVVDALEAVIDDNNQWYCLVTDNHTAADVEALAGAIEARRKIYVTSTQDPVTPSATTTDIASTLSDASYTRTAVVYHTAANTSFPEASWTGKILPTTPGSTSWNFKNVAGLDPDNLTDTQRVNLRSKEANMYTRVGGVNIFQDGVMADGRKIAEIIIVDWIYARLQEAIYSRLANLRKIPFNLTGRAIIENEMNSVLSQAVANGAIDTFTVTPPDLNAISQNDKINGTMGVFTFTATFQGEVDTVVIDGTLTY